MTSAHRGQATELPVLWPADAAPGAASWGTAPWLWLALAGGLRLGLASVLPLLEVEAYYWTWSLRLDLGYFDHPPAVALLIRAGTELLGSHALGVRFGHALLACVGTAALFELVRQLLGRRVALVTLAAASLAPFWLPFGLLATPDGPLLTFWTLALLCFWRAFSGSSLRAWLLCALATALALMSKYNAAQLPLVFAAFLLVTERGRAWLRRKEPWLALALTVLLLLPHALWVLGGDGDPVGRPFKDAVDLGKTGAHLLQWVALPLLLLTPLLTLAWAATAWSCWRSGGLARHPGLMLLTLASVLPFASFGVVALITEVHAHWPASACVAALPLALVGLGEAGRGSSPRFLRAALALGLLCVGALPLSAWLAVAPLAERGWRPAVRAQQELRGWPELQSTVHEQRARHGPALLMAANDFHLASHLQWLAGPDAHGFVLDPLRRNQYALWQDPTLLGRDALFVEKVRDRTATTRADLLLFFAEAEALPSVSVQVDGQSSERFRLFLCRRLLRLQPADEPQAAEGGPSGS